jgi:hypothetical protein
VTRELACHWRSKITLSPSLSLFLLFFTLSLEHPKKKEGEGGRGEPTELCNKNLFFSTDVTFLNTDVYL